MHNLGDDRELDRLSREAAGRYMPPGQPNWDALSAELDKEMPVEEKKRRIPLFWWILPVLLAGGATAYWLTQSASTETPAAVSVVKENNVAAPAEKANDAKTETAKTEIANTQQPTITKEMVDAVNTMKLDPSLVDNYVNRGKTNAPVKRETRSSDIDQQKTSLPANNELGERNITTQPAKTNAAASPAKSGSSNDDPLSNLSVGNVVKGSSSQNTNAATSESATSAKDADAAKQNVSATQSTDVNKETKNEPASPETPVADTKTVSIKKTPLPSRGKGFSFGALAGVDESTVKFTYGNEVGYNVGVSVGYHFNNKFSLHTGAIYTQKNYKLAGEDFTAPKGSWVSYYKLNNVEGYCRMWEIPLLARYTISEGKRSSVFLSTGLSSYFMTREDYDYQYFNNSGALVSRNMGYNSTDTHIMSILHLSAGFESRMSKSVSLLIEPYAKLPLGGVGFGNIHLSSFGLNFGVQLRQPAKK